MRLSLDTPEIYVAIRHAAGRKKEDMPFYEAVDFLKSQFAKFSISQYFQKLCPCAWVNSERERKGRKLLREVRVVRLVERGVRARVSFVRRILVLCSSVVTMSNSPVPKYLKFYSFYSCTSIVFLTFYSRVSIEFTNYILLRIANRIVPRGKCA